MAGERVLVVDDDELIRDVIAERLGRRDYQVVAAASLAGGREVLEDFYPDVALLDIKLPDGEGTELLETLIREHDVPCIMITAHATVESAVEALKLGASDYLEKPFSLDRLEATLERTLERTRLRREVRALRERSPLSGTVVGSSQAMQEVLAMVERIAPAESATVLLTGETGTGKGLLAHAIHRMSPRAQGPFVNVTCSALAESIMESEIFGHEKGAFTDARSTKRGLAEIAAGGTLFLDEIGELSTRLQGKLLRLIEDRTFRRVGGTADLTVDARLIAATNRDLEKEVERGEFRQDLYYRLRVFPIELPPLRHRREDVPDLARTFMEQYNREFGKRVKEIDPEALELLETYHWPGNVRELKNVIERAILLCDGETLTPGTLPPEVRGEDSSDAFDLIPEFGPEGVDMEDLERELLREALERTGGNRTEAGRLLGLSRHQIRNRLNKYGLADE